MNAGLESRDPAGAPNPPWKIVAASGVVIALFHVLRWLPPRWTYGRFAKRLGWLMRGHLKDDVLRHVAGVLGDFPDEEAKQRFWDQHAMHLGRSVFEPIDLTWMPKPELLERIELVGGDVLEKVRAEGRGAVLFLNHLGSPGAVVASLGPRGYDVAIAGNAINYADANGMYRLDRMEGLIQRMFRGVSVERVLLGDDLPAKMARVLARNGFFGMFIDFPVEEKHTVPLPFGGCRMDVHIGPALLALRHRVPVLSLTAVRTGENRHRIVVSRLPLPAPGLRLQKAAEVLLQTALEEMLLVVRSQPEQWWPWDVVRLSPNPPEA
ncbi:hypothetical protein [Luteolibacter sp. LG18]|uniref:lysophospholipid acyltransferase family protein n=1 Tax=Luteolibacter sp. LG18 TaxID=2819286 RepID=UPI002B2A42E6|nr:hypothetical protein llg_07510 [Luteolibacter sp. LG18]